MHALHKTYLTIISVEIKISLLNNCHLVDHLQSGQQSEIQGNHGIHKGIEVGQWDGDEHHDQQDPVAYTDLRQCHCEEHQSGYLVHVKLQEPPDEVNQVHHNLFGLCEQVQCELVTPVQLGGGTDGGGGNGCGSLSQHAVPCTGSLLLRNEHKKLLPIWEGIKAGIT